MYSCTFISLFLLSLIFSGFFLFSCIVSIKCVIPTLYDLVLRLYEFTRSVMMVSLLHRCLAGVVAISVDQIVRREVC